MVSVKFTRGEKGPLGSWVPRVAEEPSSSLKECVRAWGAGFRPEPSPHRGQADDGQFSICSSDKEIQCPSLTPGTDSVRRSKPDPDPALATLMVHKQIVKQWPYSVIKLQ